jgi:hypothetical protein
MLIDRDVGLLRAVVVGQPDQQPRPELAGAIVAAGSGLCCCFWGWRSPCRSLVTRPGIFIAGR